MVNLVVGILQLVISFLKNFWGSIQKPYTTYRRLVSEDPYQLLVIFTLVGGYFFLVSPLKVHSFHPFLLTLNASRLFTVALASFLLACFVLLGLGKLFKGQGTLAGVLMTWGYSLLPTLIWFLATSIFYVILPPPRTESILGKSFSLLFLTFSLSLFFWKGILYYLTLRFGLKLDLFKIIGVSLIFFPLLALYSYWMYTLGIFRVPFV